MKRVSAPCPLSTPFTRRLCYATFDDVGDGSRAARPSGQRPDHRLQREHRDDTIRCAHHAGQDATREVDSGGRKWRVAADGGLGNVFVWIAPPAGKFFKIEPKDLPANIKDPVIMDQPRCAFEPHAFVLFPKYRDMDNPKDMKETGQKLLIKNSNTTAHNTDLAGGDDNAEFSGNNAVPAESALAPKVLNPSPVEVEFKCTIHPWMRAYARVFDHPYATVTKADGTYEIKDVPAGAEVNIVTWHEVAGYGEGGKSGVTKPLKAEVNPYDYEVKKP
jgi:hypothetical protein